MEWNLKRDAEIKICELQEALTEMITADPPHPASEVLAMMKQRKTDYNLPER